MRILAFGGWGQLGADLAAVEGERPDVVIDAAAFHKVELCEADPDRAFAVNVVGALNTARAARTAGARCVFISSDYVFDGENPHGYTEDDRVAPLSVYGVSKVAGEFVVRNACPDSLVVRGSGLFGHAGSSGKGGNFVETMLEKALAGQAISVVDDQVFAPTSTRDMAERIVLLLERDAPPGTYHAANAGSCSWYRFARTIFDLAGVEAELTPRSAGTQAVRRPRYSVLLDTRSGPLGLPASRSWERALAWYLDERPAARSEVGAGAEARP